MLNNFLKNFLYPALIGLAVALVLKFFVFEFYTVEGASMQPTYYDGNVVMGLKFNALTDNFEHSDVVIVKYDGSGEKVYFIKRLIAKEGDTLEFKNEQSEDGLLSGTNVYLNGEKLKEDYIKEDFYHDDKLIEVPEGKVFVMGDNRNNSSDSRILGFFDVSDIISTVNYTIKK